MADKFSTEEKVSLLLKKNLGKPSTDTAIAFFSEPSIDARPKVFPSQIFSSDIPSVRPTTGWAGTTAGDVPAGLSDGGVSDHSGGVLRYYHKWPLEKVTDGNHMSYKAAEDVSNSVDNPLAGSVPFNLDSAGGYAVQLYRYDSGSPGDQIFDGTGEWVVDPDAGTLTFYHHSDVSAYVTTAQPPFLSFFAYVGSTGLAAASPWTVVADGIHYSDAGQTVLIGKTARTSASYGLEVSGEAKFDDRVLAQELVCTSDRRLKKAIRPVGHALTKLSRVRGVRFQWRSSGETSYGVVADEIEAQLPGSTAEGPGGLLSVNYNAAIALLIEAVKAQGGQILALRSKVASLERRLKK